MSKNAVSLKIVLVNLSISSSITFIGNDKNPSTAIGRVPWPWTINGSSPCDHSLNRFVRLASAGNRRSFRIFRHVVRLRLNVHVKTTIIACLVHHPPPFSLCCRIWDQDTFFDFVDVFPLAFHVDTPRSDY